MVSRLPSEIMKKSRPVWVKIAAVFCVLALSLGGLAPERAQGVEDFLLLVNASHPLPEDYDVSKLVLMNGQEDGLFTIKEGKAYAHPTALKALKKMLKAARKDGLKKWQISEAYRSVADQQNIWDTFYHQYRTVNGLSEKKARQAVARRVAKPGCSEHHTGLAFDITVPGKAFRLTSQCKWLAAHCAEYGFIIRYTKDKEKITGITEEPWHIRYVGVKPAKTMKKKNLCLEEYVERYVLTKK